MVQKKIDPIKNAWKRGDYSRCLDLLASGVEPRPSTIRHVLAPRQLWLARHGLSFSQRKFPRAFGSQNLFHESLALLIQKIPSLRESNRAIYEQIRESHVNFLAFFVIAEMTRSGGSEAHDLLLDTAIATLALINPECLRGHRHHPRFGFLPKDARFSVGIDRDEPLWADACRMPLASAKLFLEESERDILRRGGDKMPMRLKLRASKAWISLLKGSHSPIWLLRRAESIKLQAASAKAWSLEMAVGKCRILSRIMFEETLAAPFPEREKLSADAFAILKIICEQHASLGPLPSSILLGEPSSRFPLIRLSFSGARSTGAEHLKEDERARFVLGWLEASAALASEMGLAPMGNDAPRDMSSAYASFASSNLGAGHTFPAAAPSLAQAFNARMDQIALSSSAQPLERSKPQRL